MENIKVNSKKKKSRVFETYISKVLKTLSSSNGITSNSKQQLNSVVCLISKLICDKVFALTEISKKKTISQKEVKNSVKVLFPDDLADSVIDYGEKAVGNYNDENISKGVSRQDKACIIFPPAQAEKYLRNFGYSKIMVTNIAPVFLAGVLESFTMKILNNAIEQAKQNKRVRITIRDLEMSIRSDNDIDNFFQTNHISFLGGGVQPFIHPSLLKKKMKKKRNGKKPTENSDKKKHRFRPGTVSIREIRKIQKTSNSLTFAKYPFEKIMRETVNTMYDGDTTVKISKDVFIITQFFLEQRLINILRNSNFAAIHAGRVKLMAIDIDFVSALSLNTVNPYFCQTNNVDLVECCDDDEEIEEILEDDDDIEEDLDLVKEEN